MIGKVVVGNQALPPIGDPVVEDPCIICGSPVASSDMLICSSACSDTWGHRQAEANSRLYDYQNGYDN